MLVFVVEVALFAAYSYYSYNTYYYYSSLHHHHALYCSVCYLSTPIYISLILTYSQDGYTPLHIACWKGHESTVLVLLKNRVNPDLQDKVTSRKMMMMSMMIDHDDDNR
jgi:hypothetical protein